MDGFIDLFTEMIANSGISERYVFRKKTVELPGFFRPTKEWDLLVVREETLLVAIEAKSQVGQSFGNNFNNRTEKVMGSALGSVDCLQGTHLPEKPPAFLGLFFHAGGL
jgi:hypothetical protein